MDFIFISKVIIIASVYFIANIFYKRIDWHKKGKVEWGNIYFYKLDIYFQKRINKNLDDVLGVLLALICIVPLASAIIFLGFILLFEGTLNYLNTRTFWEQIVLISGFILAYFGVRIYSDSLEKEKKEKDKLISELFSKIRSLEEQIQELKD